jgi:glycosyltransferase involved in cell wall biosynthesis
MITRTFGIPVWSQRRVTQPHWAPPFSSRDPDDDAAGMFSVIIPLYNGATCLERAIRSVQAQTYQNFEIIVVDDASTDDSLEVARRLASEDPRIAVHAIDHSGAPARPRNHAIQRSKGEFIAFLDQDDWWFPRKLELQFAKFAQGDYAVVYSDAVYLDPLSPSDGLLVSELPAHRERFGHVPGRLPEGEVQRDLILGNFAAQLTVVVRAAWMRSAGPLDEVAIGVDCYEYLLRLALSGGSFGAVLRPLGVHDRGGLSRDQETARTRSLQFVKDLSNSYPQFRDQWTLRVREYEDALIEDRIQRMYHGRGAWLTRLTSFYDVLWLDPSAGQLLRAAKTLVPPAVRRGARSGIGAVRTLVSRRMGESDI